MLDVDGIESNPLSKLMSEVKQSQVNDNLRVQ